MMVVMSGPQSITSYYELIFFLEVDSISNNNQCGSGTYVYDDVCSLPMTFSQDIHIT